jgi:hypothetical protein
MGDVEAFHGVRYIKIHRHNAAYKSIHCTSYRIITQCPQWCQVGWVEVLSRFVILHIIV